MNALDLEPWPAELVPRGQAAHPARLGEIMPVESRTDAELARELQRVQAVEAQLAAYKAELVVALAAHRPTTRDRRTGEPGAASPNWAPGPGGAVLLEVSEFFADELALILNCSRAAATALTDTSETLLQRLPATWAALADGELDWSRARALAAELGWPARELPEETVAIVEAAVLPTATDLSVTKLRAAVRHEVLRHDADAADRRRAQAERAADVTVRPTLDGMAELVALLPLPLAAATRRAVDTYARMAKADGDPRPIGQLRAGVLYDLVLRPWDTSRPPVTAELTIVAPLPTLTVGAQGPPGASGPEPATIDGQPITAAHVRALLQELDALCPGGLRTPTGGSLTVAIVDPDTGSLRATTTRRELAGLARRDRAERRGPRPRGAPGPAARPDALPDEDGHDVPRESVDAALDRPPPTGRYTPTPAQRRFVRTRDRTCRHPGCRAGAG